MGFDTDDPNNGTDMEIGGHFDRAEIGRLKGVIYGCFKQNRRCGQDARPRRDD